MPPKTTPSGFHTITPYLAVEGADRLLDFLQQSLGATLVEPPMRRDDGTIGHANLQIGDSRVMLCEVAPPWSPMLCSLYVYLGDVDAAYARALAAGGASLQEPRDQPYGDRSCGVRDHAGNQWWLATHLADVPLEELARRQADAARA